MGNLIGSTTGADAVRDALSLVTTTRVGDAVPWAVLIGAGTYGDFAVSVRNDTMVPMAGSLLVDLSVLEPTGATKAGGLGFSLPPQGQTTLMLKVRDEVKQADTEIGLDTGGAPLRLRVRGAQPASAAPVAPAMSDEPPDADHER